MKKNIAFAFIVVLALSGCTLAIFNPIVGEWENTTLGITTNYELNSNGTSLATVTVLNLGVSTAGVWISDANTLTMTWVGTAEDQVEVYAFSEGNSIMSLTPSGGGFVREFTRQ